MSPFPPYLYSLSRIFDIDNPEYGPGAIFGGASDVYTPSASATTTATAASPTVSSTASSTAPHSEGHAGSIAGGVTGGIAIISISIAVTAIFYRRRRRSQAESAGLGTSQPMPGDEAVAHGSPLTIPSTMRFYVRVFSCPKSLRLYTPHAPFFYTISNTTYT